MVPVPPQLVGSTFPRARCQYSDGVLIGVMRPNSSNGSNGHHSTVASAALNHGSGSASTSGGGSSFPPVAPTTPSSSSVANTTSGTSAGVSLHLDLRVLDNWELAAGDELVMFVPARVQGVPQASPGTAALYPPAAAAAAERIKRHSGYNAPPKRVIMAGYRWQDVPVGFDWFPGLAVKL